MKCVARRTSNEYEVSDGGVCGKENKWKKQGKRVRQGKEGQARERGSGRLLWCVFWDGGKSLSENGGRLELCGVSRTCLPVLVDGRGTSTPHLTDEDEDEDEDKDKEEEEGDEGVRVSVCRTFFFF